LEGLWLASDGGTDGSVTADVRATSGLRPRADGTGLALSLSPGLGRDAAGAAARGLLPDAPAAAGGAFGAGGRVDARLAGNPCAWRRFAALGGDLSLGQASGYLRAGIALEGPVRFDLAAESRDGGASTSAHGLSLRIGTTL